MKKSIISVVLRFFIFISFLLFSENRNFKIQEYSADNRFSFISFKPSTRLFLCKAVGNLRIDGISDTDPYEVYFHIPVPFQEQIPILVEVESSQLIDYRFLGLNYPNVIIAAKMKKFSSLTNLSWTTWVLVKENTYSDLPISAPMPSSDQLPEEVKKWLLPTDCVQVNSPIVQETAKTVRGNTSDLIKFAKDVNDYCYDIPWKFPHRPSSFDAVYALRWGNSCTGHAHAAAALLRANGVPARTLLNMPTWGTNIDIHWITDYYVPNYGWVRIEPSIGRYPYYPEEELVTLACFPEDEFPLFYPCGIEGYWHTSTPALGMMNPNWAGAHSAEKVTSVSDDSSRIERAFLLSYSLWNNYSKCQGTILDYYQYILQDALNAQRGALDKIKNNDIDGFISKMEEALKFYQNIPLESHISIFSDDFEKGGAGWIHGGTEDEWELDPPTYHLGPESAYSGSNCWGMDLDNSYNNNADCWLKSPPINLEGYVSAFFSFWVWNQVQDRQQGYVYDPLWLEISTDGGNTYSPLSSEMGGGNDDPEIPNVGGWTKMVFDLTKYAGKIVEIRFRFRSDSNTVQAGPYIDDVEVYGIVPGIFELGKIAGTVKERGVIPVSDAFVMAGRSVVPTDWGGYYKIELLPGKYIVIATKPEYLPIISKEIIVRANETTIVDFFFSKTEIPQPPPYIVHSGPATSKILLAISSNRCHGWSGHWSRDYYENNLLKPLKTKIDDRLITCHHKCTPKNIKKITTEQNPGLFVWIGGGLFDHMECDASEGIGANCTPCRDELGLEGRIAFINCEFATRISKKLEGCKAAFGYWTEMSYILHFAKYNCDYFSGEIQPIDWYAPYYILTRSVIERLAEGYTVKEAATEADTLWAGFLDWLKKHPEVPYRDDYIGLSNLWSSLSNNIYGDPNARLARCVPEELIDRIGHIRFSEGH